MYVLFDDIVFNSLTPSIEGVFEDLKRYGILVR